MDIKLNFVEIYSRIEDEYWHFIQLLGVVLVANLLVIGRATLLKEIGMESLNNTEAVIVSSQELPKSRKKINIKNPFYYHSISEPQERPTKRKINIYSILSMLIELPLVRSEFRNTDDCWLKRAKWSSFEYIGHMSLYRTIEEYFMLFSCTIDNYSGSNITKNKMERKTKVIKPVRESGVVLKNSSIINSMIRKARISALMINWNEIVGVFLSGVNNTINITGLIIMVHKPHDSETQRIYNTKTAEICSSEPHTNVGKNKLHFNNGNDIESSSLCKNSTSGVKMTRSKLKRIFDFGVDTLQDFGELDSSVLFGSYKKHSVYPCNLKILQKRKKKNINEPQQLWIYNLYTKYYN